MADVANINGNAMTQDMTNALDLSSYPNDMRMDIGGEDPVFTSVEPSSDFKPIRDIRNGSNETQNAVMSGAGAGPLPTDFGAPSSRDSGGNSTLTEFTKRRNWSQRVLEELRDFLHILTPDGRILYVSPSVKALTGYESSELVGKFISDFVHPDDSAIFIREFNEAIATGHAPAANLICWSALTWTVRDGSFPCADGPTATRPSTTVTTVESCSRRTSNLVPIATT